VIEDLAGEAKALTNAIRERLRGADTLVPVDPRERVEPGSEIRSPVLEPSYSPRR
jgi:hypothetical protein